MTREQVNEAVKAAARAHGFETTEESRYMGFSEIISEDLNFRFTTNDMGWAARSVDMRLDVAASVRRMGGNPTAEELLRTADEIRRGAELLAELQAMDLTWVETF